MVQEYNEKNVSSSIHTSFILHAAAGGGLVHVGRPL